MYLCEKLTVGWSNDGVMKLFCVDEGTGNRDFGTTGKASNRRGSQRVLRTQTRRSKDGSNASEMVTSLGLDSELLIYRYFVNEKVARNSCIIFLEYILNKNDIRLVRNTDVYSNIQKSPNTCS